MNKKTSQITSALALFHTRIMRDGRVLLALIAGMLLTASAAAQTCGNMTGRQFTDALSAIELTASQGALANRNTGGTADQGYAFWDQAISESRQLQPCNAMQRQYLDLTLEWLNWMRNWEACYYNYYIKLASGDASVGQWLACISPVNAGITSTAAARSAIFGPTLEAQCSQDFCENPPDEAVIRAELYRSTLELANQLASLNLGQLKKEVARGVRWAFNPERAARVIAGASIRKAKAAPGEAATEFLKGLAETAGTQAVNLVMLPTAQAQQVLNGNPNGTIVVTTSVQYANGGTINATAEAPLKDK